MSSGGSRHSGAFGLKVLTFAADVHDLHAVETIANAEALPRASGGTHTGESSQR